MLGTTKKQNRKTASRMKAENCRRKGHLSNCAIAEKSSFLRLESLPLMGGGTGVRRGMRRKSHVANYSDKTRRENFGKLKEKESWVGVCGEGKEQRSGAAPEKEGGSPGPAGTHEASTTVRRETKGGTPS